MLVFARVSRDQEWVDSAVYGKHLPSRPPIQPIRYVSLSLIVVFSLVTTLLSRRHSGDVGLSLLQHVDAILMYPLGVDLDDRMLFVAGDFGGHSTKIRQSAHHYCLFWKRSDTESLSGH